MATATTQDFVLFWCDNVAIDTYAAALSCTDPRMPFRTLGAVHVGRPITTDPDAPRNAIDPETTARYDRIDGRRLAGFLHRAGRDPPVYLAGPAEVHVVPRAQHIDTADLLRPGDEQQRVGDLDALVAELREVDGTVHVIGAGPLTGLERLIDDKQIRAKLGTLVFQGGLHDWTDSKIKDPETQLVQAGSGEISTRPFAKAAFNNAAAPAAAYDCLTRWPGDRILLPTDITRHPAMEFSSADELDQLGFYGELVDAYRKVYGLYDEYQQRVKAGLSPEKLASFRDRPTKPVLHDAHLPVILADRIRADHNSVTPDQSETWCGDYGLRSVEFSEVPATSAPLEQRQAWGSRPTFTEAPGRNTGTYIVRYHAGSPDQPAQHRHRQTLLGTLSKSQFNQVRPAEQRALGERPKIGARRPAGQGRGIHR